MILKRNQYIQKSNQRSEHRPTIKIHIFISMQKSLKNSTIYTYKAITTNMTTNSMGQCYHLL